MRWRAGACSNTLPGPLRRQAGQAVIWVAVFTPFFLAIIGLAVDGGLVLDQEQGLQRLARTAARVGAEQVDRQAYYASQGATLVLNVPAARQAALAYVTAQSPAVSAQVTATGQGVVIRVERQTPLAFLRIIHLDQVQLTATGEAQLHAGTGQ